MTSKLLSLAVSVKKSRALDKVAIAKIGIPSLCLMESAGRAVADEVAGQLKGKKNPSVCILCGVGNNAGDGFVAARHLRNCGIKVKVFLIGAENNLKHDPALHYQVLKKIKCPLRTISKFDREAELEIKSSSVIVDAIFGVGLNRNIADPYKSIIEALNSFKKKVVSVDIPSGLDGTTGKIYGVCVKAQKTVTFTFLKKGFLLNDGPRYTGRVVVVDIGIPKELIGKI